MSTEPTARQSMPRLMVKLHHFWPLLLAGLLMLAADIILSKRQYQQVRQHADDALFLIAEQKARAIEEWLGEKQQTLTLPADNLLTQAYLHWQKNGKNAESVVALLDFLRHRHNDIRAIWIVDRNGQPQLGTSALNAAPGKELLTDKLNASSQLIDFYRDAAGETKLGITVPLHSTTDSDGQAVAYAVIEIAPAIELYPRLQQWPGISSTAETLIFRADDDSILYLSPSRHNPTAALNNRLPRQQTALIANQAANAKQPIAGLEGVDYRGIASLGAGYPITGTHWFLVSKMDESEAFAEARQNKISRTGIFLVLFILLSLIFHLRLRQATAAAQAEQDQKDYRLLRAITDCVGESLLVVQNDGALLTINRTAAERLGGTPEKLAGQNLAQLLPSEIRDKHQQHIATALASQKALFFSDQHNGRDFENQIYPMSDGKSVVIFATDTTQRNASERAIQQSVLMLQHFLDHLPGAVYVKDASLHIRLANEGLLKLLQLPQEAVIGQNSQALFPPDIAEKIDSEERLTLADGQTRTVETSFRGQHFESTKFVIPGDSDGYFLGSITRDISERVRASQRDRALLEIAELAKDLPEKQFLQAGLECAERLTGSSIAFLHLVNEDQQTLELLAWTSATLRHCALSHDVHYPLSNAGIWADCARLQQPVICNDYPANSEKRGLPTGHTPLQRLVSVPVLEAGKLRLLLGVGNKAEDYQHFDSEILQLIGNELWRITRRKRLDAALQAASQVMEASPVVCFRWIAGAGWPVAYVSANVRRWGYDPEQLLLGHPQFTDLIHPDDKQRIFTEVSQYTAEGRSNYTQEYRLLTADGRTLWVEDITNVLRDENGVVRFYDGVVTDIDERKRFQEQQAASLTAQQQLNKRLEEAHAQLLQSEKLAAIGQLAAGVAHELNNPIGFVYSNLGSMRSYARTLIGLLDRYAVLENEAEPNSPALMAILEAKRDEELDYVREDMFTLLEESHEGLTRVRKIIQDLKDFSRSGDQDWQFSDLHKGIDSTLNMARNELKYKCTVTKNYGPLPQVCCIISQLNQVFMNLLVNAAQAIEGHGEITITTTCEGEDEDARVRLTFRDTGAGISPENLRRIFDPFFTTKPVGLGTGLGLSLVFGIIERHHGSITVDSIVGQGTTFQIVLPVQQPIPSPEPS